MARTNAAAVKEVLLKDYDAAAASSLTPFIDTATAIVDRVATCATNRGITLTAAELELVERWLAAHAYAMSDQPYAERETERASGVFQGRTGMRLEATKYGQMALTIDNSGCLESISKRKVAGAFWLGKPRSEQIDYEQRD